MTEQERFDRCLRIELGASSRFRNCDGYVSDAPKMFAE